MPNSAAWDADQTAAKETTQPMKRQSSTSSGMKKLAAVRSVSASPKSSVTTVSGSAIRSMSSFVVRPVGAARSQSALMRTFAFS